MPDHRHILVVGATSGVGEAVAKRLARESTVTAVGRRVDRLEALASFGIRGKVFDVSNLGGIGDLLARCVLETGPLTALVYCAGIQEIKPLRTTSIDKIQALMTVNLIAPLVMAGVFSSRRVSTDDSVFCAVSSIAAEHPEPGILPYAASKAGLNALIKGLGREIAPRRAVAVAPGWLDTDMTRAFPSVYSDSFIEQMKQRAPRGIATVESVAETISFLLSDRAKFITGEIVTVDGGTSL